MLRLVSSRQSQQMHMLIRKSLLIIHYLLQNCIITQLQNNVHRIHDILFIHPRKIDFDTSHSSEK